MARSNSTLNPGLQVWYAYGRKMLNSENVNYSFGTLDKVFRSAFKQLELKNRNVEAALLLGLGAGNVPQLLRHSNPKAKVTALEFDPEVIRLGKEFFGLGEVPNLEIKEGDAFEFIPTCTVTFDLIIVDLFVDENVPEAASSQKFLEKLAALLNKNGLVVFNRLGHTSRLHQQTEDFGRKMKKVLPGTRSLQADTNTVYVYEKK